MYKKLSREEEKMIREHTDASQPAPKTSTVVRNMIVFALIFLLFVVGAYMVLISITE